MAGNSLDEFAENPMCVWQPFIPASQVVTRNLELRGQLLCESEAVM